YARTVADAHQRATAALDRKLLSEVQREQTREWKAQRASIEDTVTTELYAKPEYQALAAIRKGEQPDGTPLAGALETPPLKLSRQLIVERYGEERLARLPKPYVYTVDGG